MEGMHEEGSAASALSSSGSGQPSSTTAKLLRGAGVHAGVAGQMHAGAGCLGSWHAAAQAKLFGPGPPAASWVVAGFSARRVAFGRT